MVKVNDDSRNSITIKSNFLDLSEPCVNSEIPNEYLINKDFVKANRITKKIVLHQKLESLDVEEFFDEINPTDEVKLIVILVDLKTYPVTLRNSLLDAKRVSTR